MFDLKPVHPIKRKKNNNNKTAHYEPINRVFANLGIVMFHALRLYYKEIKPSAVATAKQL